MNPSSSLLRRNWLLGASVGALVVAASAAHAQSANPLGRQSPNPAVQAAQAAAQQAQQGATATAATQRARAAFEAAAARRRTMDVSQQAARLAAAAAASNVPNGLGAGGLDRDPGYATNPALWTGALAPTQTTGSDGRTKVTIEQTQANAFLNWTSFNVGRETDLRFNQAADGSWTVVNRVTAANANPTQILGTISAPGTVLVMNRNGVIFGGTSQVNVGSLIAAAGARTDADFSNYGIFSAKTGLSLITAFTDLNGEVRVEAGAQLKTLKPDTVLKAGGNVMLFGAAVTNAGTIETPKGQTILASGDTINIRAGFSASNLYSSTRGTEVYAPVAANSTRGKVTNSGVITAREGDITLTGGAVTQNGILISSSSVNQRGTIHLSTGALATSSVTIGADSYTAVLPELESTEVALDAQRDALITKTTSRATDGGQITAENFLNRSILDDRLDLGRIEVTTGGTATFKGGSITQAQGGQIAVQAVTTRVEGGATLDVSGVRDVALDIGTNAIKVNIQGFELRDSPINRDNEARPLFNQNVWVDARDLVLVPAGTDGYGSDRYYTAGGLIEASGYLGTTAHRIGEWLAVGGTITLSGTTIRADEGSVFNLMGGSVNYSGGTVRQTLLQGTDGKLYTVGNAPKDMKFVSVGNSFAREHDRWGAKYTETYQSIFARTTVLTEESGYVVGRDGGKLAVLGGTVDFAGTIDAEVIHGANQTMARPTGTVTDPYKLGQFQAPLGGSFASGGGLSTSTGQAQAVASVSVSNTPRPSGSTGGFWIKSDSLNNANLGAISLGAVGTVVIADGLKVGNGGSISLGGNSAGTLDLTGDLVARGGSINMVFNNPIVIGDGQRLDTRGLWLNELTGPINRGDMAFLNGGRITITGGLELKAGGTIDASAGAVILADGTMRGGNGGDISIASIGGFVLDGTLRSYGFGQGGKLTLNSNAAIVIGSQPLATNGILASGEVAPFDLQLAEGTVVRAGTPFPTNYQKTLTSVAAGEVAPNGSITYFYNATQPITLAANFTIPASNVASFYMQEVGTSRVFNTPGQVVPAGTKVYYVSASYRSDYTLPAAFATGLPLTPFTLKYVAGQTYTSDVALPSGATILAGRTLPQAVKVTKYTELAPSFFQKGFSGYAINSNQAVEIGSGNIVVTQPVYRFDEGSKAFATGSNVADAVTVVLPDLFTADPRKGTVTQRAGASLTLGGSSTVALPGTTVLPSGLLRIGKDASITVDPGQNITLSTRGKIVVEGDLTARGGTINLLKTLEAQGAVDAAPVWVGGTATLDASGIAFTARDLNGNRFGTVTKGGAITVGNVPGADPYSTGTNSAWGYVVVNSGAVLDVSGASATFDSGAGREGALASAPPESRLVTTDGGTITLNSWLGIVVDDALQADGSYLPALRANAGGAGASGGTLNFILESPTYDVVAEGTLTNEMKSGRIITVTQDHAPSGITAAARDGKADPALVVGQAKISVRQIEAGGFDSLQLFGRTAVRFDGNVDLAMGRALTIERGSILNSKATGVVNLSAPYLRLSGKTIQNRTDPNSVGSYVPSVVTGNTTGAALNLAGGVVDVLNLVYSDNKATTVTSGSDVRFLAPTSRPSNQFNGFLSTTLASRGNLTLIGDQVYPASNAYALAAAGATLSPTALTTSAAGSVLTIGSNGRATPDVPYSAFGTLNLSAEQIAQNGVVRAPLGALVFSANKVTLGASSVTSASGGNLVMPFGGTTDGLSYYVDGVAPINFDVVGGVNLTNSVMAGVTFNARQLVGEAGSVVDVSGGGTLLGGAFVSGRGGSVDTLIAPRMAGGKVYALVPGAKLAPVAGGYSTAWTGAVPDAGQQITIPGGVPGLPAGTYTLMPANYALLPGAFRVELGAKANDFDIAGSTTALTDGSYLTSAIESIQGTGIVSSLPTRTLITPGAVLRTYSQYNEQSLSDFQIANAAVFGKLRPLIEADGRSLRLNFTSATGVDPNQSLKFDGKALFGAAKGGYDGRLNLTGPNLIVTAPGSTTTNATGITVSAASLQALNAPSMILGGTLAVNYSGSAAWGSLGNLRVEDGVKLSASQVFLAGANITVGKNVEISTLGKGFNSLDAAGGLLIGQGTFDSRAMILVSNGAISLNPPAPSSLVTTITIGDNASFLSDKSVAIASDLGATFLGGVNIGTRELTVGLTGLNIGDAAALASVPNLPAGLVFNQAVLDKLLAGDPAGKAPALERLTLSARNAVSFFGSVNLSTLDADGKSRLNEFVISSPAIYGYGSAADSVKITTSRFVWNGSPAVTYDGPSSQLIVTPTLPKPRVAGLSGAGSFQVNADQVIFGFSPSERPYGSAVVDRLMLGFDDVSFTAATNATVNSRGTVAIFKDGPVVPSTYTAASYAGTGGKVTISTPLFTAGAGSEVSFYADTLKIQTPTGKAASTATDGPLGGTLAFTAKSIDLDTTMLLPSGKLALTATNDLHLGSSARLDLSGRTVNFVETPRYTWGGDVDLIALNGGVTVDQGSVIDLSAANEDAGRLTVKATGAKGVVALNGTLRGSGGKGQDGGAFVLSAQTLAGGAAGLTADFAALNTKLNDAGFTYYRGFAFQQGNLTVGNEVKARSVMIAANGGSLTVNGKIDAAGERAGLIRLAARDDLVLAPTAVLDLHGTKLDVDSYGEAIEATNRGTIELASSQGWVRIGSGATLDVTSPDGVARGRVDINARRVTETGGDIKVDAAGNVNVRGVDMLTVSGFWTYSPTDALGTIVQSANAANKPAGALVLDTIDAANQQFYANALGNSALQTRLGGLKALGAAYHLRPGVEIVSTSQTGDDLRVLYDLDLAGYRYGPKADRNASSLTFGAGEPLTLLVRAADNLSILGSVSDGFGVAPYARDENAFRDRPVQIGQTIVPGYTNTQYYYYNFDDFTLGEDWTVPEGYIDFWGDGVYDVDYNVYYEGDVIPAGTRIYGSYGGFYVPYNYRYPSILVEARLPQAKILSIAPMLAPGSLSASMRFVSGADLAAADMRGVKSVKSLAGGGNLSMNDYHTIGAGATATPTMSVIRTGVGALDLIAGGDLSQDSYYAVYTAGSDTRLASGNEAFNASAWQVSVGSDTPAQRMYYPDHGGDLTIVAGGNLKGYRRVNPGSKDQLDIDTWLFRQGAPELGQPTAWGINFARYLGSAIYGFSGFGTLGGGNVNVDVGGNIGNTSAIYIYGSNAVSRDATFVAASTGRVTSVTRSGSVVTGGTLVQTGGGDLNIRVAGSFNPTFATNETFDSGTVVAVRGDARVAATAIGGAVASYGTRVNDPRAVDPFEPSALYGVYGKLAVGLGDGEAELKTRGDLASGTVYDVGWVGYLTDLSQTGNQTLVTPKIRRPDGRLDPLYTGFQLWTDTTALHATSAGGDVAPFYVAGGFAPSQLDLVATSGNIYFFTKFLNNPVSVMQRPAPNAQIDVLAAKSIYGASFTLNGSGAPTGVNLLSNPFRPAWVVDGGLFGTLPVVSNIDNYITITATVGYFAFAPNTPISYIHANDTNRSRIVALSGDIAGLTVNIPETTLMYAGRDIVGTAFNGPTQNSFINSRPSDVTEITAGRNVINFGATIAGPGAMVVSAGEDVYFGQYAVLNSTGNIGLSNRSVGADVVVVAGAQGIDYQGLLAYLDPANQLEAGRPLEGSGKVVKTYQEELKAWLKSVYGFTGTTDEARAYFGKLPAAQQQLFLRQVYYAELTAGGREYNDPDSGRFNSYLRGRNAIAALFPQGSAGSAGRTGDVTMFGSSAVRTDFGGSVQILAPYGQVIVGVGGKTPPANAGLVTQGTGDIQVYAKDSLLLGLSRVMTTFGGNILVWSAEGDINAGRGAKTTIIFAPPRLTYDLYGNVLLAPQLPTAGAGIATLDPIPEVAPGDVDLIAPLGTVDAGEAGIRVSGNINIAALRVVNAANIEVKGKATGIPVVAAVDTGALTSASNAAASVSTEAERLAERARPKPAPRVVPSIVSGRLLGFGDE